MPSGNERVGGAELLADIVERTASVVPTEAGGRAAPEEYRRRRGARSCLCRAPKLAARRCDVGHVTGLVFAGAAQ